MGWETVEKSCSYVLKGARCFEYMVVEQQRISSLMQTCLSAKSKVFRKICIIQRLKDNLRTESLRLLAISSQFNILHSLEALQLICC